MATFTLNNWSAINLSLFSLDVNVDPLISVLSNEAYVTSYSSISASGYFGSWQFSATGINFTSSNPVFNTFSASLGSDFIKLSGSISDFGGTITSMSFRVGTTAMSFTGSIRLDANFNLTSVNITSATIAVNGYKISYTGNIVIDAFDNVSGTVTSFLIEDQAGNQLSATGISISAALFDSYANPETHSDLSALITLLNFSGSDVIKGGANIDVLNGVEGSDIYLIANASDHNAAEISDTGASGIDEVRLTDTALTGIETNTLTLFAGDTGIERVVIGTGTGVTAVTTGTLTLNIDATEVTNALTIIGNNGNNSLTGTGFNDTLVGNLGNDTLVGNGGDDTLNGGGGADTLVGGIGNDTYIVDNTLDVVTELDGEGTDTVQSSITHTLAANVENLSLSGINAINGTGNSLDNTLIGNIAANILDGGAGADTMDGGKGNDTYIVDDAGDSVVESLTYAQGGGIDLVKSSISYSLGSNQDNLTLTGTDNINGTGNELNNTITGNSGNNVLDGGNGVDTLIGGLGNDTYIVDVISQLSGISVQDKMVESLNGGIDTVILRGAAVSSWSSIYVLPDNFENVDSSQYISLSNPPFSSATGIAIFGNAANNVITGNNDQNELWGGAGNDTLDGGLGEDTLYGGAGSDILIGGEGSDRYVLEDNLDIIYETGSFGSDTIIARFDIDLNNYVGIENVLLYLDINENFSITGNDEANGLVGNGANNTIKGEGGNDYLDGNTGNDTLDGGAGNDVLEGFTGNDILIGGTGNDTLFGDDVAGSVYSAPILVTGNDTLTGGDGDDVLYGGKGIDSLSGGNGSDTYVFDTQLANTNIDTIQDFIAYEDIFQLDNDIFTNIGLGTLNSNTFHEGTAALDADTRIIYNSTTGALLYDADGAGSTAAVQFATLSSANLVGTLTQANFTVVD